jgi:hypothetical protein
MKAHPIKPHPTQAHPAAPHPTQTRPMKAGDR